jgi:hypothetical protein
MKSRKRMPDFVSRLIPSRFRDQMIERSDARTPTLAHPGRRRAIEEIRLREINEELIATLERWKP